MKNLTLVLVVSLLAAAPVFGDNGDGQGKMEGRMGHRQGGCNLKLTDDQKAKMRAEHFKFEENKIDLEAQLKHSKLAYKKLVADPDTDYKTAKAAAELVAKNQAKLAMAKEMFHTEVAFTIFNSDQRAESLKCHHGHHHFMGRFASHRPFFSREGRRPGSEGPAESQELSE
jgi:Spy/CpxP family protein refolding chaperone